MLVLNTESACDICLDSYNTDGAKAPASLSCGHVFCKSCIYTLQHRVCPICRQDFSIIHDLRKLHVDLESNSSRLAVTLELRALELSRTGDVPKQQQVVADIEAYLLTKPPGYRSPLSTVAELLRLLMESTAQFHVVLEHAQDDEKTLRHRQEMEKARLAADGRRLAQENEALKDGLSRQKNRIVDLENELANLRQRTLSMATVQPTTRRLPPASPLSSPMQLSPNPLIDKPAGTPLLRPSLTPLITLPGTPTNPNPTSSLLLSAPSLRRKRSSNGPLGPRERNGPNNNMPAAARPPGAAPSAFLPKLDMDPLRIPDSLSYHSLPSPVHDGGRRTSMPEFVSQQQQQQSDLRRPDVMPVLAPRVPTLQPRKLQRTSQPSSWCLVDYPSMPLVDSNQSTHESDMSNRPTPTRILPKQPFSGTVENVNIPPRPTRPHPPSSAVATGMVDPGSLTRKRALRRQSNRDILLTTDL